MVTGRYKDFSNRLIHAMKAKGYVASRSPSGICMQTLSKFSCASEQICRRYIRGDALPDYERVIDIAKQLAVSPGWLLFGEETNEVSKKTELDETLLHYILKRSHHLYPTTAESNDDYANFVLRLVTEIREINTSKDNLLKIIDLALSSISSYEGQRKKHGHVS
jgi:hypothetical protein